MVTHAGLRMMVMWSERSDVLCSDVQSRNLHVIQTRHSHQLVELLLDSDLPPSTEMPLTPHSTTCCLHGLIDSLANQANHGVL